MAFCSDSSAGTVLLRRRAGSMSRAESIKAYIRISAPHHRWARHHRRGVFSQQSVNRQAA